MLPFAFTKYSLIAGILWFTIAAAAGSVLLLFGKGRNWKVVSTIYMLGFIRLVFAPEFYGGRTIKSWRVYGGIQRLSRIEVLEHITVLHVVLYACGIGGIVFALLLLWHLLKLRICCNKAIPVSSDNRAYRMCLSILQDIGYHGKFCLSVANVSTAESVSFFKPCILLPQEMLDFADEELYGILRHEIIHYEKKDQWIRLGLLLCLCLMWWNPMAYALVFLGGQLQELRCDNAVFRELSEDQQDSYLDAMIHNLNLKSSRRFITFIPSGFAQKYSKKISKYFIDQRFRILCYEEQMSKKKISISMIICILLFLISYSFIAQPAGLPSQDDLDSMGAQVVEMEDNEMLIIRRLNGDISLIVGGREVGRLSDEEASSPAYTDVPTYDEQADE